jgi:hypothetical protein
VGKGCECGGCERKDYREKRERIGENERQKQAIHEM